MTATTYAIDTLKRQLRKIATSKAEAHHSLIQAKGEVDAATRQMEDCDRDQAQIVAAIIVLGGDPDEPVSQLQPGERA